MLITIINLLTVLLSIILIVVYVIYISYKLLHGMDLEDAKFMRTDRKPGTIDVHPTLNALVLNYELEVQILGSNDNVLYGEKSNLKRIIELPSLNTRTDCNSLAKEVLVQCDLIHPSRLVEVEQTIYYLKKRKLSQGSTKDNDNSKTKCENEDANINCLNEYIELLYEDVADKIKASNMILQLARDPDNLEALSKNETALSALARVLREDWKRSIVLSTNLVFSFFCFSTYSCFHQVILHYKIGSLCMEIIEYELRRYDEWKADLDGVKPLSDIPGIKKSCPNSASLTEIPKSRIPEPVRPKSGNFSDVITKSMEGSFYDDISNSTESIEDKKLTEVEKAKRYRTLIKKQEQLLRVAFYLLLNISENENVEEKMTKKNIVGLLIKTLERDNCELLVLVVTFLKKLSIMQVNKDEMGELSIIEKLPKLLQSNSADLVHLSLKLLYNLSFDDKLCLKMIRNGLLPKFVSLLTDDRHQEIVIKLLYHLSYDNNVRAQFALTDCVSLIADMLMLSVSGQVDQVMVALCINLATHPSNAQELLDNNRLQAFVARAFRYKDILLMKMLRNISEHASNQIHFVEFVGDLTKAATESNKEDFTIECLGILSNIHVDDLDWGVIFKHFNLIKWIQNIVKPNNVELDLVLQVIVFLGSAAYDEGCSLLICKSDIPQSLIEVLKVNQEDDEIVLQILFVFLAILSHDNSADFVINDSDIPAYLIDLSQDNNQAIRDVCDKSLNIILDQNTVWADRIRIERFRNHNAQWLQMVDSHQLEREDEEEDELPPYLNTEYLSTAVLRPLSGDSSRGDVLNVTSTKDISSDYFEMPENAILQDFEMESLESL